MGRLTSRASRRVERGGTVRGGSTTYHQPPTTGQQASRPQRTLAAFGKIVGMLLGKKPEVHVVTALPSAELFLDGQSLGTANVPKLGYATWSPQFKQGSTLKAQCRSSDGHTVVSHTIRSPGEAAALRLSLDAPNEDKGTGSALVLDGQDVALVRAAVVDKLGNLVTTSTANVTFSVSGPGRVIASHNGDPACHTPNLVPWHEVFHGFVRGLIQVTTDAATPPRLRKRILEIDMDSGHRTRILDPTSTLHVAPVITVTATSPGLTAAKVEIPVSMDAQRNSVLAAAERSLEHEQKWTNPSLEETIVSIV